MFNHVEACVELLSELKGMGIARGIGAVESIWEHCLAGRFGFLRLAI